MGQRKKNVTSSKPLTELTPTQFQQIQEKTKREQTTEPMYEEFTYLKKYGVDCELLIAAAKERLISIFVLITECDPNNLGRDHYAQLKYDQLFKVWENRPNEITIEIDFFGEKILVTIKDQDLIVAKLQADMLLKMINKDYLNDVSKQKITKTHDLLIAEVKSYIGRLSAEKRHENNKILKAEAQRVYQKNKKSYPSKRQAAKKIYIHLNDYCVANKLPKLSIERGEQTTYEWLLALEP